MTLPNVEGPVTGGPGLISTGFDLAAVGYEQQEYVIRGSARAFTASEPLTADGRWDVVPAADAPYATRVVVYRPVDPARYTGTVVVEWFNVSAGFDTAPDWLAAHNVAIREGIVWIGVSAQQVGDAADHPGDSFSYDIYSQVGRLARGGNTDLTGGAPVQTVVAIGESQSAFRLVTYVNARHRDEPVFDGFLIHSRGGDAAPLRQAPDDEVLVPEGTIVRTDLDVPVLVFQTENDFTLLSYFPARQPDTDRIRVWEVAGTAHADAYTAGIAFHDTGDGRAEQQLLDVHAIDGGPLQSAKPINAGPAYAVLQAALHGLVRWAGGGEAPATAPRLEVATTDPVALARDEHGNALGGVRTPFVDVPTAALSGDGNDGETFCRLFGTTTPFDPATLQALYSDHDAYTSRFDASIDRARRAGFLRPEEADNLKRAAAYSAVPGT